MDFREGCIRRQVHTEYLRPQRATPPRQRVTAAYATSHFLMPPVVATSLRSLSRFFRCTGHDTFQLQACQKLIMLAAFAISPPRPLFDISFMSAMTSFAAAYAGSSPPDTSLRQMSLLPPGRRHVFATVAAIVFIVSCRHAAYQAVTYTPGGIYAATSLRH